MTLVQALYQEQIERWPSDGQQILAQFDDNTVIVYQAFSKDIAEFAVHHRHLGGNFRLNRMSWIKPNFLWMMYRAGWATKAGQEHILAMSIMRTAFEEILRQAVHSHYLPDLYESEESWQHAVAQSEVRLQWDPDHDPIGRSLRRRAIQLGLRGQPLAKYAREWIVSIEDITEYVHEQHQHVQSAQLEKLLTPLESVYPITDLALQKRLGIAGSG